MQNKKKAFNFINILESKTPRGNMFPLVVDVPQFLPMKSSAENASASHAYKTTREGTFSSDSSHEKKDA